MDLFSSSKMSSFNQKKVNFWAQLLKALLLVKDLLSLQVFLCNVSLIMTVFRTTEPYLSHENRSDFIHYPDPKPSLGHGAIILVLASNI